MTLLTDSINKETCNNFQVEESVANLPLETIEDLKDLENKLLNAEYYSKMVNFSLYMYMQIDMQIFFFELNKMLF